MEGRRKEGRWRGCRGRKMSGERRRRRDGGGEGQRGDVGGVKMKGVLRKSRVFLPVIERKISSGETQYLELA